MKYLIKEITNMEELWIIILQFLLLLIIEVIL